MQASVCVREQRCVWVTGTAKATGLKKKEDHETDGGGAKPLNHAVSMEHKPSSHETRRMSSAVFLCLLNCMNKDDIHEGISEVLHFEQKYAGNGLVRALCII